MAKPTEFTPFPEPRTADDAPLVTHAGFAYRCTGCGGPVPDGAWLAEDIADGMVIGLRVTAGQGGPVVHACGTAS
jgi:hypothetical protein